jgi:hypothetical protein
MAGGEILTRSHAAYLRARVPSSARAAAVVMTPSDHVRQQVLDRFGLDPARVLVVSAPVFPGPDHTNSSGPPPVAGRYFVYPAAAHRHKNHAVLLEAFAGVAGGDPDVRLVLKAVPGNGETDVGRSVDGDRVRGWEIPMETASAAGAGVCIPGYGDWVTAAEVVGFNLIVPPPRSRVVGDAGLLVDASDVGVDGRDAATARRRHAPRA